MFLGGLVALCVLAPPVRAAYMLPGSPLRPKDFTLVKKDGYYHVFYILNSGSASATNTEVSFGHAMSADLYHWGQLPPVLKVDSLGWDNLHVWAPCIVERDGLYWMLYTGVSSVAGHYNNTQRMGLAVSADLMTWNRVETAAGPVFAATQVPWAWQDSGSTAPAFRDPFVMQDPANPGQWLMYYTCSYGPDSTATVVGMATSNGDFRSWTDAGPLLETWRNYSFNALTESPHLFQHAGLWYLFITTNAGQALSLYTGTDPTGPPSAWTYRGRLRSMLGYDTTTWFASEHMRDGTHDLFAWVNGDRIEIREIQWNAAWTFALLEPDYFHVLAADWAKPVVHSGEQAQLCVHSANPLAGPPRFATWLVDSLGGETPVAPESLGFAAAPALLAEQDTVRWLARRWPAVPDGDTVSVTRIRIRTTDSTAVSSVLTVRAPAPRDTVITPVYYPPDEPPGPEDRPIRPVLRTIASSPVSDGPALVVLLHDPAAARVDLFDVTGRRVRALAMGELPAGASVLPWDGRDDAGRALRRGIYFARLQASGCVRTARVLLLPR